MPQSLSTHNAAEVVKAVTRPMYLLEIGFTTPLRLASRDEDVTYDSDVYSGGHLRVTQTQPQPMLEIYNADFQYSPTFLSEWSTKNEIAATLLLLYGDGPFSPGDANIKWEGVLGPGRVREWIRCTLAPFAGPTVTPWIQANQSIFARLPADGTEIVTAGGTFVLRRNRS